MKIRETLLLSLAVLALTACPGGNDIAPKDEADKIPGPDSGQNADQSGKTDKDETKKDETKKDDGDWRTADHGVPPELREEVRNRNTSGNTVLLDLAKPFEVGSIEDTEGHQGKVLVGEWSSAELISIHGKMFGLPTFTIDSGKPWFRDKVLYAGKAVSPYGDDVGKLMYYVDFGTMKGHGSISGFREVADIKNVDSVILDEIEFDDSMGRGAARLKMRPEAWGWNGNEKKPSASDAKTNSVPSTTAPPKPEESIYQDGIHPIDLKYVVGLYGPKADEVAGRVMHRNSSALIFLGTRWNDPTKAP